MHIFQTCTNDINRKYYEVPIRSFLSWGKMSKDEMNSILSQTLHPHAHKRDTRFGKTF